MKKKEIQREDSFQIKERSTVNGSCSYHCLRILASPNPMQTPEVAFSLSAAIIDQLGEELLTPHL
jgi:hypothetical protein